MECELQLCPRITPEHINLTPFCRMNVRLAFQFLSESVSTALLTFGPPESISTAKYCDFFVKFFDCMNVRNFTESSSKIKPFLAPYYSQNDGRFTWLTNVFLNFFQTEKIPLIREVTNFPRLTNTKCLLRGKPMNLCRLPHTLLSI